MRLLKVIALNGTLREPGTSQAAAFNEGGYAFVVILVACCLVLLPKSAVGQTYGVSSHSVTVNVQPVTVLQINVGIVNLSISGSTAVAGQDQMTVADQTTTLLWGTNSSLKKITVNTSLASPLYTLKVLAVSPTVGTAAPEVTLSTAASDLLLNIGRSSGSCQLRYTGVALASQGTGSDAHTITFTVQTQ